MLVAGLSLLLNLQTHTETRLPRVSGTCDNDVSIMPPPIISKLPARPTKSATDSIGRTSRAQSSRWTWSNHGLLLINGVTDPPVGEASANSEVEVGGRVL